MKKIYICLNVILLIVVLSLAVLSGLVYLHRDKTGPEIIFGQDATGYDGINNLFFLTDVTATDPEDGDVTDSLRIKSVLETEDEYIVTYLAKDSSNNISERSRHIEKKR